MPRMNCPYCGDLVSYPKSQSGETSDCPYCDHEISLPEYVPKDRKNLKLFAWSLITTTLVLGVLIFVVYVVMQRLDVFADMATGFAGIVLTFVVGGLTVGIAFLWIVFPLFAYNYLGRIARATESSESLLQIISKNTGSG